MTRWMLALPLILVAGCWSDGPTQSQVDPNSQQTFGDAKLLIDWTIGGQAPSTTLCATVDHLALYLDNGTQQVEISPIPCNLTRFRYDGMPDGAAQIELDAFDANNCRVSAGSAQDDLTSTLPSL